MNEYWFDAEGCAVVLTAAEGKRIAACATVADVAAALRALYEERGASETRIFSTYALERCAAGFGAHPDSTREVAFYAAKECGEHDPHFGRGA